MKKIPNILFAAIMVFSSFLMFPTPASADCVADGATVPIDDGDDVINCSGITSGDLSALGGNDTITNNGALIGNLNGDGGNDTITNNSALIGDLNGGNNDDTITNNSALIGNLNGDGGNDTITNNGAFAGNLNGDGGNDTITNNASMSGNLNGGDGDDVITNKGGASGINGGNDNDTINIAGSNSGTTATGGTGTNVFNFMFGAKGSLNLVSQGNDTLDFSLFGAPIVIDLSRVDQQMVSGADCTSGLCLTLSGLFQHVVGTPFNDTIKGNSANNHFTGGAGTDTFDGGANTDTVLDCEQAEALISIENAQCPPPSTGTQETENKEKTPALACVSDGRVRFTKSSTGTDVEIFTQQGALVASVPLTDFKPGMGIICFDTLNTAQPGWYVLVSYTSASNFQIDIFDQNNILQGRLCNFHPSILD